MFLTGRTRLLKRHECRFLIERCCCSPALSEDSETHQLWLGTAPRRAIKNRTSCGPRIRPGAWPARSTRRSSSPWDAPSTPPKLWLEPCPVLSDGCTTGNRHRCTATPPSASNRSSAGTIRTQQFRAFPVQSDGVPPRQRPRRCFACHGLRGCLVSVTRGPVPDEERPAGRGRAGPSRRPGAPSGCAPPSRRPRGRPSPRRPRRGGR